jgi:A/G-specific adenine glycosylase
MAAIDADAVLDWYAEVRRDLPWRRTRDPYLILVSEVMLQQTQVARVVPYFEAFVARFPTAEALAAAPAADVLALWSGLGYNRRALALRAAAQAVVRDGWPADAAGLRALPGIGPYTAAAVASFAFGEQVAAVDTNVRRIVERLDRRAYRPRELAERAAQLLPPGRAADWNQAMMELGATVCGVRAPGCDICPVAPCASRGIPGDIPRPARRARAAARRFEETDRYVRGRIVAALVDGAGAGELVAGRALPAGIDAARVARALDGLERDGLIVREGASVRLP